MIKLNPFTGQFDFSGSGSSNPNFTTPVATEGDLPSPALDGQLCVVQATRHVYVYSTFYSKWVDTGLTEIAFAASSNANGVVLSVDSSGAVVRTTIQITPADGSHPGAVSTSTQTFAGDKTFLGAISASNLSGTNTGDVTLASVGSSPSASGASLSGQILTLQPADSTHPGVISTGTQSIAGDKTFDNAVTVTGVSYVDGGIDVTATAGTDTLSIGAINAEVVNIGNPGSIVNIQGTVNNINSTNLNVTDQLITINDGGPSGSGGGSGIEVEEGGSITGYTKVSGDRNSWTFKAPNTAGVASIVPGSSGITIDQSSHNPVTLGTTNGLSLSGQQISLAASSGSTTGALSSTDWTTFNNKANHVIPSTNEMVYVNSLSGSDVTGDGSYDKPFASVNYALTTISDASSTKPYAIMLQANRQVETGDLLLKPYVFIIGAMQRASYIRVNGGSIKPDSSYGSTAGWTGFKNVYIGGSTAINWDLQALGGSNCVMVIEDCTVSGNLTFKGRNAGGGDYLEWYGGIGIGTLTLDSVYTQIQQAEFGGLVTVTNTQAITGNAINLNAAVLDSGIAITSSNSTLVNVGYGNGVGVTTTGTMTITSYKGLPAKSVRSLSGGTTVVNVDNASAVPYTPTTSGDWSTQPTDVLGALDILASSKQPAGNYVTALTGDVSATGPGSASATVNSVGGSSAANVHAAELLANAATDANTASTLVKRDASGNFSAGTITATLSGNATTATTATNFSGSLSGDVTGTQSSTVVATVGGKTASQVSTSVDDTTAATSSNTVSTIVKRDSSGNFSAGTITSTLWGNVDSATNGTPVFVGQTRANNVFLGKSTGTVQIVGNGQLATDKTLTASDSSSNSASFGASQVVVQDSSTNSATLTPTALLVQDSAGTTYVQVIGGQVEAKTSGSASAPTQPYHLTTKSYVDSVVVATPTGDILPTSFTAADNQSSAANITGFAFANASVRGFRASVTVTRGSTYAIYTLNGIQKASSWELSQDYLGDATGITFSITSAGQIQYTTNATGSTATVKFRAEALPV